MKCDLEDYEKWALEQRMQAHLDRQPVEETVNEPMLYFDQLSRESQDRILAANESMEEIVDDQARRFAASQLNKQNEKRLQALEAKLDQMGSEPDCIYVTDEDGGVSKVPIGVPGDTLLKHLESVISNSGRECFINRPAIEQARIIALDQLIKNGDIEIVIKFKKP